MAELPAEGLVPVAFPAPEQMVAVGGGELEPEGRGRLVQGEQQRRGIRAAAEGHGDRSRTQQTRTDPGTQQDLTPHGGCPAQ